MLMNVRGGPSRAGTLLRPPNPLVSPPAVMDRHTMMWTDFRGSQFPDDEGGDGPWNVGLLTTKQSDTAASLRTFYSLYHLCWPYCWTHSQSLYIDTYTNKCSLYKIPNHPYA